MKKMKVYFCSIFFIFPSIILSGKDSAENKFPFLANLTKQQKDAFFNIRKNPNLTKQDVKEKEANWATQISSDVRRAFDEYMIKEYKIRVDYQKKLLEESEKLTEPAKEVFRKIETVKANMDITKKEEKKIISRILSKASPAIKQELKRILPKKDDFYRQQINKVDDKTYGIDPDLVQKYLDIKRKSNKTKLEIKNEQAKFIEEQDEETQKKFRDHLQEVDARNEVKQKKELELYEKLSPQGKEVYDKILAVRGNDELSYKEEKKEIKDIINQAPKSVKNELKVFKYTK
uniref:DUF148 domain-containing protein n=1 Tax=Strongyloides venezuelensis TaxID=75913 RepID=A0A0K0FHL3_STRVS